MYEILDNMIEMSYNMYENNDCWRDMMTQSTKRAAWKAGIWSVVLVVFAVIFFSGEGAEGFAHDRGRIVTVAVLFILGYAAFFAMLGITRTGGTGRPSRDERDERNEGRAAVHTLTVTLVYVYITGIALWAVFQDAGSVPAGWMWFLAYSTVFIGMISHGVLTLLIGSGRIGNGEG
jgi:formate hydrogenlyase subunit 3/multisubunit Na+/H+ antiporter MnhD subunit